MNFADEDSAVSWAWAVDELAWRGNRRGAWHHLWRRRHVGSIAPAAALAIDLVAQTPGLTLTLDYTHFIRLGMADAEAAPLLRYASHFHVHGARRELQTPFKDNVIDYRAVIAGLHTLGYMGWLGIEYVWIDSEGCNECDNLSETILFGIVVGQNLTINN